MKAKVKTGADRLAEGAAHPMIGAGRRIGLVTNPTGITADFRITVDVCAALRGAKLTALFAGEHGLYGGRQAGEKFGDEIHPDYGIPVFSLYGEREKPTGEMLASVDTVVFDMQDLGMRFYTYLTTLIYVMEACAEHGKSLLVLDRPSPLGGLRCEGGLLAPGFESMVGAWTMPIVTGMTIGEFAQMYNKGRGLDCDLDVLAMTGWHRGMEYPDTGLPWIMPSPNMPAIDTVRVYPGTCFFEGTNLSEGRGTTRPFEWIGAPWIDGRRLADRFNAKRMPGVHAHPVYATPTFSKHQGELCGGVRLFVTDPSRFEPVNTGLSLLHDAAVLFPDRFEWLQPATDGSRHFIDLLTGGSDVRKSVVEESGLKRIENEWREEAGIWKTGRVPYLLYGEEAPA